MTDYPKAALISASITKRFIKEANNFYESTHDILPINNGDDNITKCAVQAFVPYAIMALKEGGLEVNETSELDTVSSSIFSAFYNSVQDDEKQKFIMKYQTHYTDHIKDELSRRLDTSSTLQPDNIETFEFNITP